MMNERDFERQGLERLQAVLREVSFVKEVKVERQPPHSGWDAEVAVRTRSQSLRLLVECKRRSEPRFLREASARFELARLKRPEVYPVVVASYVSADSAAICREHGVGYLDLAGNCLLSVGEIHIEREGFENPFQEKRPLMGLFSPTAERVLRALLEPENWGCKWTFRDLAEHVRPGVSLGYVHKVVQALRDEEYVEQSEEGVRLRKPEPLLLEWARNYRFGRNQPRRFFSLLRPGPLEAKLAEAVNEADSQPHCAAAFASFTAAGRIAPYVRQNRVWLYFQGDLSRLTEPLELKEVPSGENVVVFEPYDEGIFYQCERYPDGGIATGAVQTYLDVKASGGQGKEAAEKILERVLRPKWGGA
jgi:hypothetical protein